MQGGKMSMDGVRCSYEVWTLESNVRDSGSEFETYIYFKRTAPQEWGFAFKDERETNLENLRKEIAHIIVEMCVNS